MMKGTVWDEMMGWNDGEKAILNEMVIKKNIQDKMEIKECMERNGDGIKW